MCFGLDKWSRMTGIDVCVMVDQRSRTMVSHFQLLLTILRRGSMHNRVYMMMNVEGLIDLSKILVWPECAMRGVISHLDGCVREINEPTVDRDFVNNGNLNNEDDSGTFDCIHKSYQNNLLLPNVGMDGGHLRLDSTGFSRDAYNIMSPDDFSPIETARARFLDFILDNFISSHVVEVMNFHSDGVSQSVEDLSPRKVRDVKYLGDSGFVLPLMYVANMYETMVNEVNMRLSSFDGMCEKTMGLSLKANGGLFRKLEKKFSRKGLEIIEKPVVAQIDDAECFKRLTGRSDVVVSSRDYKFFAQRHNNRRSQPNHVSNNSRGKLFYAPRHKYMRSQPNPISNTSGGQLHVSPSSHDKFCDICGSLCNKADGEGNGSSGGILTVWDNSRVFDTKVMGEEGFLAVIGSWKRRDGLVGFINVYAPQDIEVKANLWDKISRLIVSIDAWYIFGDFNKRYAENVKEGLKAWSKVKFGGNDRDINALKNEATKWEIVAESGDLDVVELERWKEARRQWIEKDNLAIKAKVVEFYKNIFAKNESSRPVMFNSNFKKISSEEKKELEQDVEEEEIIGKMLVERIKKVIHKVVGEEKNGFIQGRYILDGALISNEAYDYLKKQKKKAFLLKIDFEKAYDSINWKFIQRTLLQMGFGEKLCKWIEACQTSTSISVLVNGSPTLEFKMEIGVRQGDPLSPFLYLVAAEGLNVTIKEAVSCGYFNGVKIGSSAIPVSHLQYTDDTLIFGEWKESNAINLMRIMECVKQASGLKTNSNKTKVYGIGVQNGEIEDFANRMGISPGKMPFMYLGIPIGVNMKIVDSWKIIVEKFKKRLGNGKTKMISFGGRLTLVKSVLGSLALYFFSLFHTPMSVLKNLESM
ncbi:putative RNA-directed DNA polymerase [Tanacetum coccineum]